MRFNPVTRFILDVLIWLPFAFVVWYALAPFFTWPLGILVGWITTSLFPGAIAAVELQGPHLDIITTFPLPSALASQLESGQQGDLVFTLNPLIYSYNLPLYTALIVATPGKEKIQWQRWGIGLPFLYITQAWGVCFDILKTLLFNMGQEIAEKMAFLSWQLDGIALGYQLGYLILPPVMPIAIWIVLHRDFLVTLVWGETIANKAD